MVYADTDSVFIKRINSAIDYNEVIDTLSKCVYKDITAMIIIAISNPFARLTMFIIR